MSDDLPDGKVSDSGSLPDSTRRSSKKRRRNRRRKKKPGAAPVAESTSSSASNFPEINSSERETVSDATGTLQRKPWFRKRRSARKPVGTGEVPKATTEIGRTGKRRTRRPGRNTQSSLVASEALIEPKLNPENNQARPKPRRNSTSRPEKTRSKDQFTGSPYAYAALDLGTNNCRLLIAIPGIEGEFRVVGSYSRIVRLGDGLEHSGRLSDDAMDRAIEALQVCAERLDDRRIKRVRLIATEACRRAENGQQFLDRVLAETGIELEIVDRETEARLAVSGCGSLIAPDAKGAVLFDIGGGSTEIALLKLDGQKPKKLADNIKAWTSLPVGVVTLADRFGGRDVTSDLYRDMVDNVKGMIEGFVDRHALDDLVGGVHFHLLGTSGTVTTLAGIHLDLQRYDRRRVDGLWMKHDELTRMVDKLLAMDFAQRQKNPCIGVDRADLVLAGCAILDAIRDTWHSQRLRVADRGLREGLLMEMMHEDAAWRSKPGKGSASRPVETPQPKRDGRRRSRRGRGNNKSKQTGAPSGGAS